MSFQIEIEYRNHILPLSSFARFDSVLCFSTTTFWGGMTSSPVVIHPLALLATGWEDVISPFLVGTGVSLQ